MNSTPSEYVEHLRLARSLLIVSSLQDRQDKRAVALIEEYTLPLVWEPLHNLMIDPDVWRYVVETQGYEPRLVFCHPEVIKANPITSLHYRGLCGLSLKTAQDYVGALGSLEAGNPRARLTDDKARRMAQVYYTPELERRMDADRLVERRFDLISLLDSPAERTAFFTELFHHTLRLI